ncbi:MAG: transposase [Chloroflexi bacterium]|nr:transposase [Chloroflexota bacterium]MBI4760299.1 transposase [Chloroflexota bacterium]
MAQPRITSERIDELPLLIAWLKRMQVDVIIDRVLGTPHGNWEGLSYGEVALVFVAYVLMCCTHFLNPMQEWAGKHLESLSQALGKPVRAADFTDDRLALLLSRLGDEQTHPETQIELALGQHLLYAYALPTETTRIDMTTVSVHHRPKTAGGLMQFGYSKDHRPDLRQFKQVLGTLDPVGIPLATAVVSGEQADDPQYLPMWERFVAVLGRTDFLTVGDCKLASLANRAQIHSGGGFYLTPLPLTGDTPTELNTWVLNPPSVPRPIRLPKQAPGEAPVGKGFEVPVECAWQNPDTSARVTWCERRLVVQSVSHAKRQQAGLHARLTKAESALRALKPSSTQVDLEKRVQALLMRHAVTDYLEISYLEHIERKKRYIGSGRPGPNRPSQVIETHTWKVKSKRRQAALRQFKRLAGWRIYVTNTPAPHLSLADAVNCYRQEWQPEHGFHRLKSGLLALTPLFLKDEHRIRGLLLLLGIALRALTLIEFVVRRELARSGETLKGLYSGNPNRTTAQPTAERVLKAFHDLTLYRHDSGSAVWYAVTTLTPLQHRILQLMQIPEAVYAPPSALIESG